MTCYHPITVGRSKGGPQANGKWPLCFTISQSDEKTPLMQVPCGRCIGCRENRAQQWTIRMVHEAQMHERSCFITLTYDNDHLPKDEALNIRELQLFWKRLRKGIYETYAIQIRYFVCGEYGTDNNRPHYHAAIFGFDFPDRKLWTTRNGNRLYTSDYLKSKWDKGYNTIGEMDYASAAYLAGYIDKKIKVLKVNCTSKQQEFQLMSRRPGIGAEWINKYQSDIYPKDILIVNGLTLRPPKYYDTKYQGIEELKIERSKKIKHLTKKQLNDIELNKMARKKLYKKQRSYEQGESEL